jgi:hypothetical protein
MLESQGKGNLPTFLDPKGRLPALIAWEICRGRKGLNRGGHGSDAGEPL